MLESENIVIGYKKIKKFKKLNVCRINQYRNLSQAGRVGLRVYSFRTGMNPFVFGQTPVPTLLSCCSKSESIHNFILLWLCNLLSFLFVSEQDEWSGSATRLLERKESTAYSPSDAKKTKNVGAMLLLPPKAKTVHYTLLLTARVPMVHSILWYCTRLSPRSLGNLISEWVEVE